MKPEAYVGFSSIQQLAAVLSTFEANSVFLVTGKQSYSQSGAEEILQPFLRHCAVRRFCEFSPNPTLEEIQSGIKLLRGGNADVVVAVGGGSAIDAAKLINVYASNGVYGKVSAGRPLIAIPTTAGTGSEATQFATVYIDRLKHSISDEALLPDVAIVDPAFTRTLPPRLTAISGMDALAQAIESYWGVRSTDESKNYAREAIELIVFSLQNAVNAPEDFGRLNMARAAFMAGKAINVTRTTAPHALSYALTAHFGVPHGHAVSLTLPGFLVFNYGVSAEDVVDPRGPLYVKRTIEEICRLLGARSPQESSTKIQQLMYDIGLATTFAGLRIDKEKAIEAIVREVNLERLINNPRRVTKSHMTRLLEAC